MPGRRPLVDVPFAREMSLTSIISDISKVPFFPPKIQKQYFLKFFRTKGDYKSEQIKILAKTEDFVAGPRIHLDGNGNDGRRIDAEFNGNSTRHHSNTLFNPA
jgi:hypothetical protein